MRPGTIASVNQDRDGWATSLLLDLFKEPGDEIHSLFDIGSEDMDDEVWFRENLGPADLVLTSTRLDIKGGVNYKSIKKKVPLADTWFERQVTDRWRDYFARCTRKELVLTGPGLLTVECAKPRRRIRTQFSTGDEAKIIGRPDQPESLGVVLFVKDLWPEGPSCLSAFAMSGPMTFGFVSALHSGVQRNRDGAAIRAELQFTDSELLLVAITPPTSEELLPSVPTGRARYWDAWTLLLHRQGFAEPSAYTPQGKPGAPCKARILDSLNATRE